MKLQMSFDGLQNIPHLMYHINNITYTCKNSRTALVYLELMANISSHINIKYWLLCCKIPTATTPNIREKLFLNIKE